MFDAHSSVYWALYNIDAVGTYQHLTYNRLHSKNNTKMGDKTDSDLIALLRPSGPQGYSKTVITLTHNRRWYCPFKSSTSQYATPESTQPEPTSSNFARKGAPSIEIEISALFSSSTSFSGH